MREVAGCNDRVRGRVETSDHLYQQEGLQTGEAISSGISMRPMPGLRQPLWRLQWAASKEIYAKLRDT